MRAIGLDCVTCHKCTKGLGKGFRDELELHFLFADDDTAGITSACPRSQHWFESHCLLASGPSCSQT